MKIGLYIADILFRTGGTEANCAYIVYALQNIYHDSEITIISETYKDISVSIPVISDYLNSTFGLSIKNNKIDLMLLFADKDNFINRALFEQRLRKTSKKFDLFFNCSMNIFSFAAKKNIAIVHFPPYRKINSKFVKKYPSVFFSALQKDLAFSQKYTIYISYSQYVQKWLNKIWHINKDKTVLINPAVNLISKTGEEKDDFIFICSRIEQSKEIEILVSAYLSNEFLQKTLKLVISGAVIEETTEYVQVLKKMICNYSDLILLHENPLYKDIESYYNRAKIFWHAKGFSVDEEADPSSLEHFGLTTVEAMSAGCVPVVINKGGQKEIVDDEINGFRWDTPEQLIEKTIYLVQNEKEYKKMSEAARNKAQNYSLETFTQNLGEVLRAKQ
ncbi:hypothetical protein AGMMS50230_21650 [Spirochaetia bacterium]|nr:hypothetical protein AGMMS50230_21650 [Spirochaetia bacterium]